MNILETGSIAVLHQPLWLLLMLVPVVSLFLHMFVSNKYLPKKYFDPKMRYWYLNHNKSFQFSNKKYIFIDALFWIFFSISLAGPEYAETFNNEISKSGDKILVLLDVSASMNSRDEQPSRLLSAKNELLLLIDKLKQGDKLGVLLFAGSPHLLFPPTSDKNAMRFFIQQIKPNMLPVSGSVFDRALLKAEKILTDTIEKKSSAYMLLISDGDIEDEQSTLKKINNLNLKTPVYVLGVGQLQNTPIPSYTDNRQWITLNNGNIVTSNRNDNFLQQISDNTNGKYHTLVDSGSDLDFIYTDGMKKNKFYESEKGNTNWIQLYHAFLFFAIILFFYQRILKSGY